MSILRFLYQFLCAFLQIKYCKHIKQNFDSVAGVMTQGWDFGVLGGSKTSAWGFAMAPHRLCILVPICSQCIEGKQKSDISKGHNSVTNLQSMTGYNLSLDLVNINSHKKFGKILSMSSCNIERKQKSNIN